MGPLVLAGVGAGAGWRILTAGVIGASIGAGFVVVFGVPTLVFVLVWTLGTERSVDTARASAPARPT